MLAVSHVRIAVCVTCNPTRNPARRGIRTASSSPRTTSIPAQRRVTKVTPLTIPFESGTIPQTTPPRGALSLQRAIGYPPPPTGCYPGNDHVHRL